MSQSYKRVNKLIAKGEPSFCVKSAIWQILTNRGASYPSSPDQTAPVVIKVDVHVMAAMFLRLGIMEHDNIPESYHEKIEEVEIDEDLLQSAQQELDEDREMAKELRMDLWSATDDRLTHVLYLVV